MPFKLQKISVENPRPAGQSFRVAYEVLVEGRDEPAHEDHHRVWGSDGSRPVDTKHAIAEVEAGLIYFSTVDVPALTPGKYDISVTFPDGTGAGDTITVA